MKDLPQFVKIAEDRINAEEIVSYGVAIDEDDDRYLYIETRTSEELAQYYSDDVEFDLDEKLAELDNLFLVKAFR